MDCPQCGTTLRERDRAGIKIDFCPDCKGVWLDRGELDKIIEREAGGSDWDDRPRRSDADDDDDDGRSRRASPDARGSDGRGYEQKKSKKKSFFESLTELAGGGED